MTLPISIKCFILFLCNFLLKVNTLCLYDMSLAEVTQLMSQILTESEFNSFESAVTSELRNASKGDLREGILKILKNILGPKIDWSRITTCVQRKEETVSEYTERFCQSAVIYSGTNVVGTKVYRTAFSGILLSGGLLHFDWLPACHQTVS